MNIRFLLVLLYLAAVGSPSFSQNGVVARTIFVGDAGEINHEQETVIPRAAELVLPGKTTVLFLGDNIYPRGMGLSGSREESATGRILQSQFKPFRDRGAPVYFLPGNHDWDRMGKRGLAKIRAQDKYLKSQGDSLLKLLPGNGCPDPVALELSDSLVVIVYDSEWWLFPHKRSDAGSDCDCETEAQVTERLEELFYEHFGKTILLASHHPFRSYGVHGGYYPLMDHIFPLRNLNRNLYVPLPVIGSLYPVLRRTVFLNPEDIPHPAYGKLVDRVSTVFKGYENLVYVAGHEHGLQLIKDKELLQVVSGAGAKDSYAKKGRKSLYSHQQQGFVVIDYLENKDLLLTFYQYENQQVKESFVYRKVFAPVVPNYGEVQMDLTGKDSVVIRANPKFDQVGNLHRVLFGENYRKEWAAPTTLPVLRASTLKGGLHVLQRGGGMQSISLRLADSTGRQWVFRSVNKNSASLLPEALHRTFAHAALDDANSAQHPYSALMLPPLAEATGVPHANPVIGVMAPDPALGVYNYLLANSVTLMEEREPEGESINTPKMLKRLQKDNDNDYKAKNFLRARMLDVLLGDWDRHEDQWRWVNTNRKKTGQGADYVGVPRDRDQALRITRGVFPKLASKPFILPTMQAFSPKIPRIDYSLIKSDFLNAQTGNQFTRKEYQLVVSEFVQQVTDSVLEAAVKRLPSSAYNIRHEYLLKTLKSRRNSLFSEMDKYYSFINSIVDIRLSDGNEKVMIEDSKSGNLKVTVRKINKKGELSRKLMEKSFDPLLTSEVRVYLSGGNDSLTINAPDAPVRIRVVGGPGSKSYQVQSSLKKVRVYDLGLNSSFSGNTSRIAKRISSDSSQVDFVPVNLYNVWYPKATVGYNVDDGILIGAGFRYVHQRGFRKVPYNHIQEFSLSGSFTNGAVRSHYKGQWREAFGKADLVVDAKAWIPNSTNFFGVGNNTEFDKQNHNAKYYYRTRYTLVEVQSSAQWRLGKMVRLKLGPAFQFYDLDAEDNGGRLVTYPSLVHSYDSLTIDRSKAFGGVGLSYSKDSRNNHLMPSSGGFLKFDAAGWQGLNRYSGSYIQFTSEAGFFIELVKNSVVLADRVGGGMTFGSPAFFQSLYLGGQGNLRGYRQYRFAGSHLIYNNLELRVKLLQVGSYILPGELGTLAFYDAGRVWEKQLKREKAVIHQGYGAGLYYAPARMVVVQLVAGRSEEGWYPYLSVGYRF